MIPSLPSREASDDEVVAWVRAAMIALDDVKPERYWRRRALGGNYGEALALPRPAARIGLRMSLDEKAIIVRLAERHGIGVETYMRRLLGTALVAVERVEPDALPALLLGGMIRP